MAYLIVNLSACCLEERQISCRKRIVGPWNGPGATLLKPTLLTASKIDLTSRRQGRYKAFPKHPKSTGCHQLFVPRYRRRAFSLAGPTTWNSLPDYVRDALSFSFDSFRRSRKLFFSRSTQRIRGFAIVRYMNLLLTLTLTLQCML